MLRLLLLQALASCLWLGNSEVVKSFAECPQFFYAQTTPNDVLHPGKPVWICQRYSNSHHYATLYDKERRIPVYSAYIYQPGPAKRPHAWWFVEPLIRPLPYIEMTKNGILAIRDFSSREIFSITPIPYSNTYFSFPVQLISDNNLKEMERESVLIEQHKFTLEQIKESQAVLDDYEQMTGLDRGHLSSNNHMNSGESKMATFTLTNIVPQNSTLNHGAWKDYENKTMAQKTQGCTTTYVITGAVPGNTKVASGRINRPSHIWSAACCLVGTNPTRAWGVIAENDKNEVENLKLGELEERLTELYDGRTVTLFSNTCPR